MEIRTATSSVAIVQNSLADRDPHLAIVNVTESLIFPAREIPARCRIVFARQQTSVI